MGVGVCVWECVCGNVCVYGNGCVGMIVSSVGMGVSVCGGECVGMGVCVWECV